LIENRLSFPYRPLEILLEGEGPVGMGIEVDKPAEKVT
jgi:hypothetical protein